VVYLIVWVVLTTMAENGGSDRMNLLEYAVSIAKSLPLEFGYEMVDVDTLDMGMHKRSIALNILHHIPLFGMKTLSRLGRMEVLTMCS
jgi:hypothetical protein